MPMPPSPISCSRRYGPICLSSTSGVDDVCGTGSSPGRMVAFARELLLGSSGTERFVLCANALRRKRVAAMLFLVPLCFQSAINLRPGDAGNGAAFGASTWSGAHVVSTFEADVISNAIDAALCAVLIPAPDCGPQNHKCAQCKQ